MSIIHGDIRRENILSRYGEYYLIDWEYATFGDIAYEFAMHFIRENYNEKEMNIVLERMCSSLLLDPTSLMRDIKVYMNFETLRLSFFSAKVEISKNKIAAQIKIIVLRLPDKVSHVDVAKIIPAKTTKPTPSPRILRIRLASLSSGVSTFFSLTTGTSFNVSLPFLEKAEYPKTPNITEIILQ